MKRKIILIAASLLLSLYVTGQECVYLFSQAEGSTLVYQEYDKNDKVTGKTSMELVSVKKTAAGIEAETVTKSFDDDDELMNETQMTMRCEDGKYYYDMTGYVNQESMEAYEGMEVEVDATNMEFPSVLKVGDKLKDSEITLKINTGFFPLSFSVSITDRVVEAKETVTTQAGSFETYKINQTNTLSFGFQMILTSSEWYSKDVGRVKSVTYKSGKPYTKSELISISH